MLTYRLTGTTEETGSTGADPPILPAQTALQPATKQTAARERIFASHGEPRGAPSC